MKIEVEVKIKKDIDIEKGDLINDQHLIVSIGDDYEIFNLLSCKLIRFSKDEFVGFIDILFNSTNFEKHNSKDIIFIDYANDEE